MKNNKTVFAVVMIAVLTATSMPASQNHLTAAAADSTTTAVTKKAYSLSKKAATYSKTIRVKLTAKNGYRVYYAKNGILTKNKVLKSGQSKTFTISKTTTLTLYKSKTAKTAKQLKSDQVQNQTVKYVYQISNKNTSTTQPVSPDADTNETQPASPDANGTRPVVPGADLAPGQSTSSDSGEPDTARNTAADSVTAALEKERSVANAKLATIKPSEMTALTPTITCADSSVKVSNLKQSSAVERNSVDGMCMVTIQEGGTYILTGGSQNFPAKNIVISVGEDVKDDVHLVMDNLHIDNSNMKNEAGQDLPIISIEKGVKNADITLVGSSSLTGCGSYVKEPASAVIYAKDTDTVLTLLASDSLASLTIIDDSDSLADFGNSDPTDGIAAKGTLVMQSGKYDISVNGDCLKGTGADGNGGIVMLDGIYDLKSMLGNGMRSKNGTISIYDGTLKISHTAEDGINAKNYAVNIVGGNITIDQCFGDGIQGENVFITGKDTKLDITTSFANAGKNYYNSELGSGNYNTLTKTNTTKTEVVNIDVGSHKGIKAGTKACTYSYRTVESGSDFEAGKTYTQNASGGIVITGGQIKVNTTGTGIKYNGSMEMGNSSNTGEIVPADNDGQYIIGAAEDAVHSNNTFLMAGGTLEIASADDGISAAGSLLILNDSVVNITESYEGIEGGNIIVGSTNKTSPQITVYSNDDGVNAASKTSVHYDYTDESEDVYTKTQTAASDNTFYMLDGYLNVMIADDETHSFSFQTEDASLTKGTYAADGDGIDCNGSFYAYGGTVIVYGSASGANSPIDTDAAYYIGSGVTLLAVGSGAMAERPTGIAQAAVTSGGMTSPNGNPGGGMTLPNGNPGSGMTPPNGNPGSGMIPPNGNPGSGMIPPNGNPGSGMLPPNGNNSEMTRPQAQTGALFVSAGTSVAVLDSNGNTITAFKTPKAFDYLIFSSPELAEGNTYMISSGGSVDGKLVFDESRYDYRYTKYQANQDATQMEAVTISK